MGELFRSQPMTLVQLVIPFDVAHDTIDELGKLGVVQFKDVRNLLLIFSIRGIFLISFFPTFFLDEPWSDCATEGFRQ
jgi:hypothetical protein